MGVGSDPAIGAELGGYRLEALIGRGGMGVVYRAEDLRLGRRVALKVLSPELADDRRFRRRFLAESRLAASIDHAGIVPIFEAGEDGGLLFIAMRHVDGGDLRKLLSREGRLAPGRAVDLVAQVAEALGVAHGRGLVHRDVKPSNVLVAVEAGVERAYLADFGLTKHTTSRGGPTASGQLVGTVDYVAPEQIRGGDVDGGADLYSLGCVLFECLTGAPPFARASELATIYAHLEDAPPRPSEHASNVPGALDAVVARALAKEPDDRWRSGRELVAAARSALPDRAPVMATAGVQARMRAPRRALLAAALGLVAALAAIGTAIVAGRSGGGRSPAAIQANAVAIIDPASASLTGQVALDAAPGPMATGYGAVWVATTDDQTVTRIDTATRTIRQTIGVGSGAGAIAAGEGGVWVVNTLAGTVSWISPQTNREVKRIPVGNRPSGVCAGSGSVWVANADDGTIWKLDPNNGRRTRTIRLDVRPTELACGAGAIWASSESSASVIEISPAGQIVRSIAVGNGASGIAVAGSVVWVANTLDGTVSQIDARRGVAVRTVPIGAAAGPVAVAAGGAGVWVANEFAGTIDRLDPRRGVVATRTVGSRPQGLAVVGDRLWVGARASGERHRGGKLRVLAIDKLDRAAFDPAVVGSVLNSQIVAITNDGLTAFPRTGGHDAATPIPDLAVAMPTVSDGGRTYRFQMRPGVRYSTGVPVRPSDVRRELERVFVAAGNGPDRFFRAIRGAAACLRRPPSCDLSRGVVADDRAGTITFHLTAPDPDLVYKLATPWAVAVPPGTPRTAAPRPLPATGPYLIARVVPNRLVLLARNPQFREIPGAPKPAGHLDQISIQMGVDQSAAVRATEHGKADWVSGAIQTDGPAELDALFTRYAGQVHTNTQSATVFAFLNTRVAPFDNVDARRAVNYAVDRRAAAEAAGGRGTATLTCQMLPPNFPSYGRYCPYTVRPAANGVWRGPDVARARRLVDGSGTKGMRVTVIAPRNPLEPDGRLLVELLDRLGYHARLRLLSMQQYFGYVSDSHHRAQVGPIPWFADFPAASDFLHELFSCVSFTAGDPGNVNWSEWCDPATDRLMQSAQRAQESGLRAADGLWARVDRRIVDQAVALPLDNPRSVDLVSGRVGNFHYSPQWGPLFDQFWVR